MLRKLHRSVISLLLNYLNNKVVILLMVELDNMKQELLAYETPLAEVRDSL